MTIFQALRRGAADLNRSRRMVPLFYAAATLPAILGAAVVMSVPLGSLGRSRWPETLAGNFDLSWVVETAVQSALPAMPVVAALLGLATLSRIVQLFMLGGALQIFGTGEPFSAAVFFAGCGRNFWRIVRLALFSLLFFAAAGALHAGLIVTGNKIWGEGNEATPLIHWSWFAYAVLAVTLGLCSLAFDYAAIRLVAEDRHEAMYAYFGAIRMIWRAPARTIGLYVIVWLVALLLPGAYLGVSQVLPQTSMALVFVLFLVRQCAVLARGWTRLLFYSSQCAMYSDLRPAAPEIEAVPDTEFEPIAEPRPKLETPPSGIAETQPEA